MIPVPRPQVRSRRVVYRSGPLTTSRSVPPAGPITSGSDIAPELVCIARGKRGAEVRPNFPKARMGTG